MINIVVFNNYDIIVENQPYHINDKFQMVRFIEDLLNKTKYSGETICLETATIDGNTIIFHEINRWH